MRNSIIMTLSHRAIEFGLRLVYPWIYFGQWNKEKVIYSVNDSVKFKIRVGTTDKLILWEIWKKKEYTLGYFDIKPSDIVVDIGAHIGAFSVYAAKKAQHGKVYAYEPYKENYDLLVENVKLNRLKNVAAFNTAISDTSGVLKLFIGEKNIAGSSFYKNAYTRRSTKVPAISLKDVFVKNKLKKIDFLKMDVEGAEYDIILNSQSGSLKKINKIILEFHDNISRGHSHKQLKEHLKRNGFYVEVCTSLIDREFLKVGILKAWRDRTVLS